MSAGAPSTLSAARHDAPNSVTATRKRRRLEVIPVTPALRRLWRVPRMVVHLFHGLGTIWFVFPALDAHARRARIRSWSRRLLHLMSIDIRMSGTLAHPNVLVVANHVSWLDIFALHAVGPVRFIAKAEIARWPLLGRLVGGVGTLFIERARRHDTHRVNREVAQALGAGDIVAVFPEGTTPDGCELLPFKGSLLQPIVDANGHVQPVAIRYRTPGGDVSQVPAYVNGVTFMGSLWRICGERSLVVELTAIAPLPARAKHRRELAREAEDAIRAALALPPSGSAPDRRGGPAGVSR
jgi:1-acyl-sn-glycerol-3-phosphate acyltransferase